MASNRRRTDRTAKKDASGLARPELSFSFLSLFLLRYLNLALVLGYLLVAGDVAHGLLPYSLVLALSGVYFTAFTTRLEKALRNSS